MAKERRSAGWNIFTIGIAWLIVIGAFVLDYFLVRRYELSLAFWLMCFGLAAHVLLMMIVMYAYIHRFREQITSSPKMVATLFTICVLSYAICLYVGEASAFAMPVMLATMLACVFYDSRVGFITNVFSMLLLASTHMAVDLFQGKMLDVPFLSVVFSGFLIGTLITFLMGRDSKRISFVMYGIALNIAGAVLILLYGLVDFQSVFGEPLQLIYLSAYILLPVLLSLFLQPVLERIFNVTSNFRFVELTDPHQPLLMQLATEAPGTYNHSLTVANLVETCANAIGENVYFARCAAYYHDIGKLANPSMFTENQSEGNNIHDELTPEASTDIIRKHTINGEALCREHRIPEEVAKIAREHHGTTVIAFFYNKAKQMTDGREVNIRDFSYLGPTPSTKIAALVMICDSCEAAIRSMEKPTAESVDKLVFAIITDRQRTGQFDECPITMRDLRVVRQTIVNSICGLYHTRIKYPDQEDDEE